MFCCVYSVHWTSLSPVLLWTRTLLPHRLQVRVDFFITLDKSRTTELWHLKPLALLKINHIVLFVWFINEFSFSVAPLDHFCLQTSFSLHRCDPGFSGPACELASQTFPAFLSEGFSSPRLSSYHSFSSLRGGEVSFGCGVLASGKALVFNRDGRRHLVTAPLDSSQARYW